VTGSFRAHYRVTGGTLSGLLLGMEALLGGNWCANFAGCHPPNYSAHPNGKFDTSGPVPTLRSTWGQVKTIYR
jgi:hypothetical protein